MEKMTYVSELERQYCERLKEKALKLTESMKQNKNKFSFISEQEFSIVGGGFNKNCAQVKKRVNKQRREYREIISGILKMQRLPLSDDVQHCHMTVCKNLLGDALSYGYTAEAAALMVIMKDRSLVGVFEGIYNEDEAQKDVVKLVETLAKRAILERDNQEVVDDLNVEFVDLLLAVSGGKMGSKAKDLSIASLQETFDNAAIRKGDVCFKMDGSHYWVNDERSK